MLIQKIYLSYKILCYFLRTIYNRSIKNTDLYEQFYLIGTSSIFIVFITSFFISLVLTIQLVKEFIYLNAVNLIGPILAISFIRELSPVLTSVIVVGKVGSSFTSELAIMSITEQIDSLYVLGVNPIDYLVIPRLYMTIFIVPLLSLFSVITSLISGCFVCYLLYSIHPVSYTHLTLPTIA